MLPHSAPAVPTGRRDRVAPSPTPRRSRRWRIRRWALALGTCVSTLAGCRGVPNALGIDRRQAQANADSLFAALAERFDNVQRAPKFFQARSKLGRFALSPSEVFGDTSVWTTAGADSTRTLTLAGTHTPTGYLFAPRTSVPIPNATGDSRHVIRLSRRGESEYQWNTAVDHAIGPVRANDVASALTALFAGAERVSEPTVRAGAHALFPRASRVLGELCVLDTVRLTRLADRSTAVAVRFHIEPDRIEKTRPNFAKYLEKYVEPARYRVKLTDGRGATWIDAAGGKNAFTVSYRVRDGELLTLAEPSRPMPDSLLIDIDFSAKFMIFRVGVTNLVGDFAFIRESGERGWMMRFRHEPDWHFPLAVNHLIRSSLRRPFSGDGMTLRISVRDATPEQATLSREAGLVVQESAIVRWLGGLGSSAMSEFAGRAEAEENRYVFEVLSALRADFVAATASNE